MDYLSWDEKTITDFSDKNISDMYARGYLFTRLGKGVLQKTRSVRIDLKKFFPSSENRRILRKGKSITLERDTIPYAKYDWNIAKLAKDFYDEKSNSAFSANKVKELITTDQNFNSLFVFKENLNPKGYAICYENPSIIHYSYPFYDIDNSNKDMGLIMMTSAITDAHFRGLHYIYLGSLQYPSHVYKLQFAGLEWFDGEKWRDDVDGAKGVLVHN